MSQRKINNIRSSFALYKTSVTDVIDDKLFVTINNEFNKFLLQKVYDGEEITLPARLGTLCVIGRKTKFRIGEDGKPKNLAPDWVSTKKLWDSNEKAKEEKKLLYHLNLHTNGTIYKYLWSKRNMIVENKIVYSLKMTRANKRAVNKLILQGKQYTTKFS